MSATKKRERSLPAQYAPELVKAAFEEAPKIIFYARPANVPKWRVVCFKGYESGVSLAFLLPCLGIEPAQFISAFSEGNRVGDPLTTYEDEGGFGLSHESFVELARLFKKTIDVWREFGRPEDTPYHMFTVSPDGTVIEAPRKN